MKTSKYLLYLILIVLFCPFRLVAQEGAGMDNATPRQITTILPFSTSPVSVTVLEKKR